MPNSTKVQVRLWVPTPQCRGIVSAPASAWLGLASGFCLALGPEFPEVAHRGPSLNWSGGVYPIRELLTSFVLCVCVRVNGGVWCVYVWSCVCVHVGMCMLCVCFVATILYLYPRDYMYIYGMYYAHNRHLLESKCLPSSSVLLLLQHKPHCDVDRKVQPSDSVHSDLYLPVVHLGLKQKSPPINIP